MMMSQENAMRLGMLIEKREGLEGTKIFRMLLNLGTSHYAVSKNYQELSSAFAFYEGNLEIWNVRKHHELSLFLREFSRLLHNYLSSTFSLIRHNAKLCNDLECPELTQEYLKQVDFLNANSCVWFVKDLRHFAQHVGLPIPSAQLSFSTNHGKSELKHKILLDKDTLLDWKEWKKGSKDYINTHDEIDLKLAINEYQTLVRGFFMWFVKKVVQLYSSQIQEFVKIDREIGRLNQELFDKS